MASLTSDNNDVGLTVPLNWGLNDTDEWIETSEEVRLFTGITRYSYTAVFYDHFNHFTLRITNTKTLSYVFNDSQGNKHPFNALYIGDHTIPPFTVPVGPSIVSVTLRMAFPSCISSDEQFDPLNTPINWPLGEEGKWVTATLDVMARTGISRYSFYSKDLGGKTHYFIYIINIRKAKFAFTDSAQREIPLFAQKAGENHTVVSDLTAPLRSIRILLGANQ